MLIDVTGIIAKIGTVSEFNEKSTMESISFYGSSYKVSSPFDVYVKIRSTGDRKAQIDLNADVTLLIPCDRCLEDVEYDFSISYSREIDFNENSKDRQNNMDELSFIDGTQVNTDRLITDEIILDFPMQVLCRTDCKGLCKKCGCNLNKSKCDCDQFIPDTRMSVIGDIFRNFKEV